MELFFIVPLGCSLMGLYHYYEGGGYEDRIYQGQHTGAEHYPAGSPDGMGVDEVYIDHMSGKNTNRPELQWMMEYVRRGDTVIVESISRFARNTRDLLELVERLTAKGVEFVSKKEAIDTTTPTGKFMLTIFGAVAELEREYILQRQREGIAIAKEQGKYTGRKAKQSPNFDRVVAQWRRGEITATEAMRTLKMSKTTFYRRVQQAANRSAFENQA